MWTRHHNTNGYGITEKLRESKSKHLSGGFSAQNIVDPDKFQGWFVYTFKCMNSPFADYLSANMHAGLLRTRSYESFHGNETHSAYFRQVQGTLS